MEARPGPAKRLLWRAKKGSKPLVTVWLRSTEKGCELICDVYPVKSLQVEPVNAGPFRFQTLEDANAFAQEAARALIYLGCDVVGDERKTLEGTHPSPPAPREPADPKP